MSSIEMYKKYFTKEYLMGPNSFRLLDELICKRPEGACFNRTLDLGCGYALTSMFVANETDAEHVYASFLRRYYHMKKRRHSYDRGSGVKGTAAR